MSRSTASDICGSTKDSPAKCRICTSTYTCTQINKFNLSIEVKYATPEVNVLGGGMLINPDTGETQVYIIVIVNYSITFKSVGIDTWPYIIQCYYN